jgi:hypothetical protein
MRDHKYYFDELVLGNTLPAVTYSHINKTPLVYPSNNPPHRFEFFAPDTDLSAYGSNNLIIESASPDKIIKEGKNKLEVWNKTIFKLALKGLVLFPFEKDSLRLGDDNNLHLFQGSSRINISFDVLRVFDGQSTNGIHVIYEDFHQVLDWINISSGAKQKKEIDIIKTKNNFVNEVRFYPSSRTGNSTYKDCVAISRLTSKQLMDVEYTDTFAKFEVRKLMKESGLKGTANGFYDQYPDKERHYDIRLDPTRRDINKIIKECYTTEQNNKVIFDYRSEEEILSEE